MRIVCPFRNVNSLLAALIGHATIDVHFKDETVVAMQ